MAGSVPEWASFFTPERFKHFIEQVEVALRREGISFEMNAERGYWRRTGEPQERGLVNLAQICNQAPLDDWNAQIEHFVRFAELVPAVPEDLESLRPLIKVRLYAPEMLGSAKAVKIPLADGLVICLALDLPDSVQTLAGDRARSLGMSSEELFDLGMANVVASVQAERTDRELKNGGRLVSLAGDDFFTTTLALALDEYAGPEPEHGFVVAVPNRHEVLAIPLESARSIGVLPALVSIARDLFRQGPGSLSPFVYWVRRRRWARLDLEESEKGLGVAGPQGFIDEVLNPLLKG